MLIFDLPLSVKAADIGNWIQEDCQEDQPGDIDIREVNVGCQVRSGEVKQAFVTLGTTLAAEQAFEAVWKWAFVMDNKRDWKVRVQFMRPKADFESWEPRPVKKKGKAKGQ